MINIANKLFGYKEVFNYLVNLDKVNKLPSKILLTGQNGIGKTTFALHFCNYLFSKKELTKYDILNNTINPNSISKNLLCNLSHPNFYFISKNEDKNNIEIDQIRNLINFINKSSFNNDKKLILIDGVENLNANSANALLKSLEDSNEQNIFLLTYDVSQKLLDTIKSRCMIFNLNFDFKQIENVISEYFASNLYNELNNDFKMITIQPKFLINHIIFLQENDLGLSSTNVKGVIQYIIDNKSYKNNFFIKNNFQSYIEIYFSKMYMSTKNYNYYVNLVNLVTENNLINKLNLDLDSFFLKFEKKYLNI